MVRVVETRKTKESLLALCVRNIWLLTASYDINLNFSHIPGFHDVIADTLSQIYSDKPVNANILTVLEANYIWKRYQLAILTLIRIYNFRL